MTRSKSIVVRAKQRGYTLIDVAVAIAVVLIIGTLTAKGFEIYTVKGRAKATADEINQAVAALRGDLSAGGSSTPYASVDTSTFGRTLKGFAAATVVNGTSSFTVNHRLGDTASVSVAPADVGGGAGSGMAVTLASTSEYTCPGFAAASANSAYGITINGTAVKTAGGAFSTTPSTACATGNTNAVVLTYK